MISCLLTYIYCILLNIPLFLSYSPADLELKLKENETYLFYSYQLTDFGKSQICKNWNFIGYILRDTMPLISLIILNILMIINLRRYFYKKFHLNSLKIKVQPLNPSNKSTIANKSNARQNQLDRKAEISKVEIRTCVMVICICAINLLKNSLIILSILYPLLQTGFWPNFVYLYAYFFIFVVSVLNFLVIYSIDKKLNSSLKKLFTNLLLICKIK